MARQKTYSEILSEQQSQYEKLAKRVGNVMAIYFCCVRFDVPFDPTYIPKGATATAFWEEYMGAIECAPEYADGKGDEGFTFLDGVVDIKKALQAKENVAAGKDASISMVGTPKQRSEWGFNRTQKEYNELDRIYNALASDLMAAGGLSVKQDFILRDCAVMTLERDKMIEAGEYAEAAKLNKMIQENLASEGLRKRDAKPIDDFRLDSLTAHLEKAGLMKDGKLVPPDEIFKIIFRTVPKYPYTLDAAEQMLLAITNCMRQNDGMPELGTLPDNMRLKDDLAEFAREQNDTEKEAYKKLGIVKMPPNKEWQYRDNIADSADFDIDDDIDDDIEEADDIEE